MTDKELIENMLADFRVQRPDATEKEIATFVAIDFANRKLQEAQKFCLCGKQQGNKKNYRDTRNH